MSKILTVFLFGMIFVSTISAQNSVVPIVYDETLLGGAQNGKWITAEQTEAQLSDRTEFNIVNFYGIIKIDPYFGTKGKRVFCENPIIIMDESERNPLGSPYFALGANAKWNLVPRIPKAISLKDKTYTKLVANILKTKGLAKTKVEITQAFRVDLEGDGNDEIIIEGNNSRLGSSQRQNVGDYSFILLRKSVKGKPHNILIEGEFFTSKLIKSGNFDPPAYREIVSIADLNGDGSMEFVLNVIYHEGSRHTIFEMQNGKSVKVLELVCLD